MARLKERRVREREGRYLIEGVREVKRALEAGVIVEALYFCPALLGTEGKALLLEDVNQVELSEAAFARVSHRESPDGLIATARMKKKSLEGLELPANGLVLVIDGLEKPGNFGALLRTADGAGLDAVFATGGGTDLYNPNVIRASMGSVFARPVLKVDASELPTWLRERHYRVVAASPRARSSYWQADYRAPTAIVLGAEHAGLSPIWQEAADKLVRIPMQGLADSLNVATAGALLIYEALRQRLSP